jgi:hypothetical protein
LLQPINNARTLSGPGFQDLNVRFQDLDLRTWISGPQREVSRPGSQDLGFRPSTRGFRTWISGPGFQDLESSPSYGRLIFFPSLFSASIVTFLFPVTFLCIHRHFSLRPVVTDRRRRRKRVGEEKRPVCGFFYCRNFIDKTSLCIFYGRTGSAGELKRGTVALDRRTHART